MNFLSFISGEVGNSFDFGSEISDVSDPEGLGDYKLGRWP